jgi:hypothetical protein
MSDPKSTLGKLIPGAIDLVGDGVLRDLREQFLPDVDERLRREANRAHDAMFVSLFVVARALVAAVHGVEPTDPEVLRFIDNAAADPAFAARTMRLLSEGIRSPSEKRRRMLASRSFDRYLSPATAIAIASTPRSSTSSPRTSSSSACSSRRTKTAPVFTSATR